MNLILKEEGISIIDVEYKDIPTVLEKVYKYDYDFQIKEGEDVILVQNRIFRVVDKNLMFVEGVYCCRDEGSGDYEPDWALTLIYENVPDLKFNYANYIYYEQDSPEIAIYNFLSMLEKNNE